MMLTLVSCLNVNYNARVVRACWNETKYDQIGDIFTIETYEEYNEITENSSIYEFNKSKYKESYFKNKVLVVVYIDNGSSSDYYRIKKVDLNNGTLEVEVKHSTSENMLCDVVTWNVILEMSKDEMGKIVDTNIVMN